MSEAYIDSSWMIAARLQQQDKGQLSRLEKYHLIYSSELLLAEVLAFSAREGIDTSKVVEASQSISWVMPDRSLMPEMEWVISNGYIRGADLWHLACACYVSPDPKDLAFLTLDRRQQEVAKILGFKTPVY